MPIRVKFNQSVLNKNNRKLILTPNETNEHVVVFLNKNNKYEFLIPLRVDLKESINKNFTFEMEIQNNLQLKKPTIVNESSLSPSTEHLDKFGMLPGQINQNSRTVERIKKRKEKLERYEGINNSKGRDKNLGENSLRSNSDRKFQGKYGSNDKVKQKIKKDIILNNVHEAQKVQRDIVLLNKAKTIKKKKIDYTKKISNKKVKNIVRKDKSDDEIFGYKKSYKLGKPNNPGIDMSSPIYISNIDIGGNITNTGQNNINNNPDIKNNNIKNQSTEVLLNNQYLKKQDPAVLFEGVPTHRSVKNVDRGTKPKLGVKSSGKKRTTLDKINVSKSLKDNTKPPGLDLVNRAVGSGNRSIRTGIKGTGSFDITGRKNKKVKNNQKPFVYSQKEINRKTLIYMNYVLEDDHLFGEKVNLVFKCINRKGLVLMDKIFTLNALDIIDKQTSIPDFMPSLSVTKNRHANFARVEVFNKSSNDIRYKIYRKVLEPSKSIQSLNYSLILEGTVKAKSSNREKIDQYHNLDCLYRMTYEIFGKEDSIEYANFSNDVSLMAHPANSSRYVVLEAAVTNVESNESIEVEIRHLPPDTDSVKLLRKSVSNVNSPNKMQKMEYVRDPNDDNRVQIKKPSLDRMVSFVDRGVVDGTTYEYRAEILLKRGTKHVSTNCIREKFEEKTDIFKPKLGVSDQIENNDLTVNINSLQNVFTNVDSLKALSDQQKIKSVPVLKLEKRKTIADDLIDKLSAKGETFTEDLKKIKQASNVQGGASITLINKTDGGRFHLGDIKEGEPIITGNLNLEGSSVKKNCEYAIKIEPYEISTKDTIDKISKVLSNANSLANASEVVNKFSSIRRSALADIKRSSRQNATSQKDRSKFFSKRRLKRGSIEPADRAKSLAKSTIKSDFIDLDYTGDIINIPFNTNVRREFSAVFVDTYVSPYHNVILTFKVAGSLQDIDFIIISAKKDDEYYPVGSAHCDKENEIYNFLDYTNSDYLGRIEYYAQAVYESGEIDTQRHKIGEAILVNKFDDEFLIKNKK